MAQQPNLFSPEPSEVPPAGDRARRRTQPGRTEAEALVHPASTRRAQQRYTRWLERAELLVRVIVRLYLGMLIIALPWMRFWTENGLLHFDSTSALIAESGFAKGLVSGLGVLNVLIALQELFLPKSNR